MNRITVLEPMRGLASLAVVWFHCTQVSALPAIAACGYFGRYGVQAFFVISGFVIPYSLHVGGYRGGRDFWRFGLKRIARLDPPYLVAITAAMAAAHIAAVAPLYSGPEVNYSVPQVASHVGYLCAFLGYDWIDTVYWTLAIEFQFYFLLAFSFPLFVHANPRVRLLTLAAWTLASFLPVQPNVVFHHCAIFAMGIATAQHRVSLLSRRAFLALLPWMALATVVNIGWQHAIAATLASLAIGFYDLQRTPQALVFLGAISYSLYLTHAVFAVRVCRLVARVDGPAWLHVASPFIGVAISIPVAWLLYRTVELPAKRLAAGIRYGSSASVVTASQPPSPCCLNRSL